MDILGRIQPAIIILAAIVGIAIGMVTDAGSSPILIEIFLILLLYILFLSIDLKKVGRSFQNVRFTLSAVVLNFVFTPILAFGLGMLFFPDSMDIRIGLLMLLVTPCTDWYLVFTGLSRGNVELGMSILPLNLILQVVLLPVYLMVFVGSEVTLDASSLTRDIAFVLVVPLFAALVTKRLLGRRDSYNRFLDSRGDHLQLLFLCLAVVVMFASEGDDLMNNPMLFLRLFVPLIVFFVTLFAMAQAVGRLLGFPRGDTVALNFTTLARNSPLALAIAVAAFPDQPLISLALVIGPLIELPVLSVVSEILLRWRSDEIPDADPG